MILTIECDCCEPMAKRVPAHVAGDLIRTLRAVHSLPTCRMRVIVSRGFVGKMGGEWVRSHLGKVEVRK